MLDNLREHAPELFAAAEHCWAATQERAGEAVRIDEKRVLVYVSNVSPEASRLRLIRNAAPLLQRQALTYPSISQRD